METEDHICPTCGETDVSPDSLIANNFLRKLVSNYLNETGYVKPRRRSSSTGDRGQAVPPPPPPVQQPAAQPRQRPPVSSNHHDRSSHHHHHQHHQYHQSRSHQQHHQHHHQRSSSHNSAEYPREHREAAHRETPSVDTAPPQVVQTVQLTPEPSPPPSQTTIPAHLIGMPPHVIKAYLKEQASAAAAVPVPRTTVLYGEPHESGSTYSTAGRSPAEPVATSTATPMQAAPGPGPYQYGPPGQPATSVAAPQAAPGAPPASQPRPLIQTPAMPPHR